MSKSVKEASQEFCRKTRVQRRTPSRCPKSRDLCNCFSRATYKHLLRFKEEERPRIFVEQIHVHLVIFAIKETAVRNLILSHSLFFLGAKVSKNFELCK